MYFVTADGSDIAISAQKGTYSLILASYDASGRLIQTRTFALTFDQAEEQHITATLSGATVKVFLWDSLERMKPLCETVEIK